MYLNSKFLPLQGEQFEIGAGKQAVPANYDKCYGSNVALALGELCGV